MGNVESDVKNRSCRSHGSGITLIAFVFALVVSFAVFHSYGNQTPDNLPVPVNQAIEGESAATETPACSDVATGRWQRFKNYWLAVLKTGGLRLAFRPEEKEDPKIWKGAVFQSADAQKRIWMHPVLWMSRKISQRYFREPLDFQPVLALEDRVLQPAIRKVTSQYLGKTYEFSRFLMFLMAGTISWLGYDMYEHNANAAEFQRQQTVIQLHQDDWSMFIDNDHRFKQMAKLIPTSKDFSVHDRNRLASELRNRILEQLQYLQTTHLNLIDNSGSTVANQFLLERHGFLFYADISKYQRTRLFVPAGDQIMLKGFSPRISDQTLNNLIYIRNRTLWRYELAYGLVTQPEKRMSRADDVDALFKNEDEKRFIAQILGAELSGKVNAGQALQALHLMITWDDQLTSYNELRIALRANVNGKLTNLPLTTRMIMEEIRQITIRE